jgi:hypothetical protein
MSEATGDALHFRSILSVAENLLRGDEACPHNVTAMVDVMVEHVEGFYPLHQSLLQRCPLFCRNDARHQVEGDKPLCSRTSASARCGRLRRPAAVAAM